MTHHDPEAGEACALWCLAIRHAVLHGTFDGLRLGLDTLPADRATVWSHRLAEAEAFPPSHFDRNGWVVQALQGAWSAIVRTPIPDEDPASGVFAAQHLQLALETAVRGGRDTDTVAAIAGGLLGARWGASAIPLTWQRRVHGWPGLRARDLIRLGLLTARRGHGDSAGWPATAVFDYSDYGGGSALVVHPHDPGVLIGGVDAMRDLPDGVDAVVSLCRLGADEVPAAGVADRRPRRGVAHRQRRPGPQSPPRPRPGPGRRRRRRPARRRPNRPAPLRPGTIAHPNRGRPLLEPAPGSPTADRHGRGDRRPSRRPPQPSLPRCPGSARGRTRTGSCGW